VRDGHPGQPTAPASPWQNGFAERLIGSIRREYVDHILVLGEMHLRWVLNLRPRQNTSIPKQGFTGFSAGLAKRCDQFTRRPDFSFRYTRPWTGGIGITPSAAGERRTIVADYCRNLLVI
jgi:hypothetical protein